MSESKIREVTPALAALAWERAYLDKSGRDMSLRVAQNVRSLLIENAENCTDAAPCAQKTAEFSDDEIIAAANGWREYDAPDGLSPIERMVYGACRAAIAADRKLRGDA